jgi:hypothetical protein
MSTLVLLRAARWRLSDPDCWCSGHLAEDRAHVWLNPEHPDAVAFCAIGVLRSIRASKLIAASTADIDSAIGWLNLVAERRDVLFVNDALGYDAVLAMYDRAIARLEAETMAMLS